jgi:hypothetical protein
MMQPNVTNSLSIRDQERIGNQLPLGSGSGSSMNAAAVLDLLMRYFREARAHFAQERGRWTQLSTQTSLEASRLENSSWSAQGSKLDAQAKGLLISVIVGSISTALSAVGLGSSIKGGMVQMRSEKGFTEIEQQLERLSKSGNVALRATGPAPRSVEDFASWARQGKSQFILGRSQLPEAKGNFEQAKNSWENRVQWWQSKGDGLSASGQAIHGVGEGVNQTVSGLAQMQAIRDKALADAQSGLTQQIGDSMDKMQSLNKALYDKSASGERFSVQTFESWIDAATRS